MQYRLFGGSGLRVSEVALGSMTFGEEWGSGASKEESKRIFDAYAERGGNFIDTANRYTEGTSERYVGEFIRADRGHFVVATKYTMFTRKGDPNAAGNHRKNMVQALDGSLKRLRTDYVDVYWLHAWDFLTPVEEVMRAFDDMVRAGKVLYIGISDTPAWIVSQANTLADLRGWTAFVGLQVEYSLIERTVERDLLPMARACDLAVAAWSPLGGGVLTGKYNAPSDAADTPVRLKPGSIRLAERNLTIAAEVLRVAREIGCTGTQVAIAWLLHQRGRIIPILGVRRLAQLEESLGALDVTPSNEQLAALDAVSAVELGFPHEWLTRGYATELVYGGTLASIVDRREPLPPVRRSR